MRRPTPPPLTVAASLVGLEALVLVALTVVDLLSLHRDRLVAGLTTAIFFAAYAVLLVLAALALHRQRTWPRGPVLITQLIALGLAWNLRDAVPVAIVLVVLAAGVLAGVLHPASIEALNRSEAADDTDTPD